MKKQFSRKLSGGILVSVILLTGCNNVLYSGKKAPVFSDTQAKRRGTAEPALINTSLTPVRHTGTMTAGSIERPSNTGLRQTNNPYGSVTANNPYGPSNTVKVMPVPPVTTVKVAPQPIRNNSFGDGKVPNGFSQQPKNLSPSAVLPSDSRIKEASEILKSQEETIQNTAVEAKRPSTIVRATEKKLSSQVDTAHAEANNSLKTAVTETKNTTEKVVKSANREVETSQKAVKKVKQTSATTLLLQEARSAVSSGDYDKAASALERAHRIEPSNAKILYDIAQIRYAQGKYSQAESFASKAASLSGSANLSKKTWSLLSNARQALGNASGAESAAKKAASF